MDLDRAGIAVGDRGRLFRGQRLGLGDGRALAREMAGGTFATLRLTSSMYHRFHAPAPLTLEHVTYHSGDTWNVNPIALQRVERLFCRNERAALFTRLADGTPLLLVPVAAILVASIRLHCLNLLLHRVIMWSWLRRSMPADAPGLPQLLDDLRAMLA